MKGLFIVTMFLFIAISVANVFFSKSALSFSDVLKGADSAKNDQSIDATRIARRIVVPALVVSVAVFFASFFLHGVTKIHSNMFDNKILADLDDEAAIQILDLPQGDFFFPSALSNEDKRTPEIVKAASMLPRITVQVRPPAAESPSMGTTLLRWFLYIATISNITAYLFESTADTSVHNLVKYIFSFTFFAYSGGIPADVIWYSKKLNRALPEALDGLVYAVLASIIFTIFWAQ